MVGDSSGANLAAAVCLLARDRGGPAIARQVLVYPATAGFDPDTPSHAEYGEGHLITTGGFKMFWNLYTGGFSFSSTPDNLYGLGNSIFASNVCGGALVQFPSNYVFECDPIIDTYGNNGEHGDLTPIRDQHSDVCHG